MGFDQVHDYIDGKADWMAAGLPTEGTNALKPRAGPAARKDVATCGLEEKVGEVRRRAEATGLRAAVVVNEERVVLGLLRDKELDADPDLSIESAMRPGPSTFRPDVAIAEMAKHMAEHKLESSPITTSDGRLVGLLLQADATRLAGGEG